MKAIKFICAVVCAMFALTASAANDSLYVRMDFNANPWGYAVAIPKGTSYSKVDLDESPMASFLSKNTDFTAKVNDQTITMTVTPSDLDETDYDNCLFYTYDYDADMSGDTRMNVLRMAIGSTMKFKAPENYRFAKVTFNTFRVWASGGLTSFNNTWGPDTAKVYQNINSKGELVWEVDAWYGDEKAWSTPACTGTTMLRYIDFWLLPLVDESAISSVATEQKAVVNVTRADGTVVRRNVRREDATSALPKGVYIVDDKKYIVK